ncbi:hypothetical protein CRENBAI_013498 [Crenichthys baileyi]|uniref:Uncharacterized protein n=1 Tax=Crenichthys baileyi TaxID=28760 RepID=A0AAV9SBJ0_9TELE
MEQVMLLYLWKADVSGFTRFFRDETSLESTTTYSRSCVLMTVAFSGTSIYPKPSLRTCCPALGDESAFGTRTAGAVSLLQNACPSVFNERTPGKAEEIGKDGTVWTVVGEEESRGRHQSQNALTEHQIQDAQTTFLCLVDAEMLIHIQGCSVAEARRVLGDDSSSDMSVDELKAFLALVYVQEVKRGRNMELSSFCSD